MANRQQLRSSGTVVTKSGSNAGIHRPWSSTVARGSAASSEEGLPADLHRTSVKEAHIVLGVSRLRSEAGNVDHGAPMKKARKERGLNWSQQEVAALIEAKRTLFMEEMLCRDTRELMVPDAGKWQRISSEVMKSGVASCHRDGPACKSKWNLLIPEYKRIVDFLSRSGTNALCYWDMTTAEKKSEGLPRSFSRDVFMQIHDWYGSRPAVQPPHTRDLLSTEDNNYNTPQATDQEDDEGGSDDFDDHEFVPNALPVHSIDMTASTESPVRTATTGKARATASSPALSPTCTPAAPTKRSLPPGVTAHLLSSSDTADADFRRRPGSIAVRRKSMSGHSLIADATRASGDALTSQMKDMADASRDLEESKIQMQLKLFTEQMEYQCERDRRLHESARQANDNARLAIQKQGEVVSCLAHLSAALTIGLQKRPHQSFPSTHDPLLQRQTNATQEAAADATQEARADSDVHIALCPPGGDNSAPSTSALPHH